MPHRRPTLSHASTDAKHSIGRGYCQGISNHKGVNMTNWFRKAENLGRWSSPGGHGISDNAAQNERHNRITP